MNAKRRKPGLRPPRENVSNNIRSQEGSVTEVFWEMQGDRLRTWPARVDVSDDKVVEDAGCLLWKRAQQRPDDALLVGAARVLHAVWVMLRARDDRAYRTMLALEKLCIKDREERQIDAGEAINLDSDEQRPSIERDGWCEGELPPRANLDRHRNLAALLQLTDLFWEMEFRESPDKPGRHSLTLSVRFFISAVKSLFPNVVRTAPRDLDREEKIGKAWQRTVGRAFGNGARPDPGLLVVDGLEVFGVPRARVHNWLKGVNDEQAPRKRAQERDGRGRFGRHVDTPTRD